MYELFGIIMLIGVGFAAYIVYRNVTAEEPTNNTGPGPEDESSGGDGRDGRAQRARRKF